MKREETTKMRGGKMNPIALFEMNLELCDLIYTADMMKYQPSLQTEVPALTRLPSQFHTEMTGIARLVLSFPSSLRCCTFCETGRNPDRISHTLRDDWSLNYQWAS